MSAKKTPKRAYNSSRRQEQARQTRLQIVEAARKLFIERGYSGTTMEAISREAGVAVETIYASFGSKRAILSKLIDISLVGDDQPIPLLERSGPQMVQHETDQRRQIELFANDMYEIMSRVAPLFDIMRAAAKSEPEVDRMLQDILSSRVQGMMVFVHALTKNRPLRNDLTLDEAAETVFTLSSGEVFTLLTTNRGWSGKQYKRWLADSLSRLLLA